MCGIVGKIYISTDHDNMREIQRILDVIKHRAWMILVHIVMDGLFWGRNVKEKWRRRK